MAFNFGDKPFKYSLPDGYKAINTAAKDNVVINSNGEVAAASVTKPISNAPQAVIIEVINVYCCIYLFCLLGMFFLIVIILLFFKPSRELAEQTYEQIKKFKKYLDNPKINELLVIGGVNIKEQLNALQNQGINIVVGTPGRLEDLISGGKFKESKDCFFLLL